MPPLLLALAGEFADGLAERALLGKYYGNIAAGTSPA